MQARDRKGKRYFFVRSVNVFIQLVTEESDAEDFCPNRIGFIRTRIFDAWVNRLRLPKIVSGNGQEDFWRSQRESVYLVLLSLFQVAKEFDSSRI